MKAGLCLLLLLCLTAFRFLQMMLLVIDIDPSRYLGGGHAQPATLQKATPHLLVDYVLSSGSFLQPKQPFNWCDLKLPFLHDPTVHLSPCLPRPWLLKERRDNDTAEMPTIKLLLTSYGWNQPDARKGYQHPRSLRQRELLQAIVDHPMFDPTAWDEYESGRRIMDPTVRHYVFLDVETCHEANYPHYGQPKMNQDVEGGRAREPTRWDQKKCYDSCPVIDQALRSPVFQSAANKNNVLVYFECTGSGPGDLREKHSSRQISVVSLSAHKSQIVPSIDQGLPPPVDDRKFALTQQQIQRLHVSCHRDEVLTSESDRPYFLSFAGSLRPDSPRQGLIKLHKEAEGVVMWTRSAFSAQNGTDSEENAYTTMLQKSVFAAAPRGTNLFSYRFTEVLASGAIPVVHSDGWVLPFRRDLLDWNACALIIPESRVNETVDILRRIPLEDRCERRQRCWDIYQRYISTPSGTIQGVIQSLDLALERKTM